MSAICRTLGIGRATAYRTGQPRARHYHRQDDPTVHAQLKAVLRDRGSYGSRRALILVNRAFETGYNIKRIRRVMRITGLALAVRRRRRNGRPHRGRVQMSASNQRWCSDIFEIACWSGELVQVGFALDCHDREALAHEARPYDLRGEDVQRLMRGAVERRFGVGVPARPIQWLSDNGAPYTALATVIAAESLRLVPITTPAASPESNGMSEAFVNTMRRDYVDGADLSSAAAVLEQLPQWFDDYNTFAPHSALGMRTPAEYRKEQGTL